MPDIQLRPTVATDLSRLMGFDHSINSESVWQLELRRDAGQVMTTFREVRLPRSVHVAYPHDRYSLSIRHYPRPRSLHTIRRKYIPRRGRNIDPDQAVDWEQEQARGLC